MNKRKRKKFQEFQFETPEITYNEEYFSYIYDSLDRCAENIKKKYEKVIADIESGEDFIANSLSKLEEQLSAVEPDRRELFLQTLFHLMNSDYNDFSAAIEPTDANILEYTEEWAIDWMRTLDEQKRELKEALTDCEKGHIYTDNLVKYCQSPERTDLDYSVDIPKEYRDDLLQDVDNVVMEFQSDFERLAESYKEGKYLFKEVTKRLNTLSPLKRKIQRQKLVEMKEALKEHKAKLEIVKEHTERASDSRNYFGAILESLPKD